MRIDVIGLRLQGAHGCHPEERKTGGTFIVDISVEGDFTKAEATDQIDDAVDYVSLMAIASQEMSIRKNLIESVAQSIAQQVLESFSKVDWVQVTVKKLRPPVAHELEFVSVTTTLKRAQN